MVTSRDVADFIVFIRDRENNILYREDYPYNIRKADIPVSIFNENLKLYREICIISKDSNGETGNWFHAQCDELPALKEERRFFFFPSSPSRTRTSASLMWTSSPFAVLGNLALLTTLLKVLNI